MTLLIFRIVLLLILPSFLISNDSYLYQDYNQIMDEIRSFEVNYPTYVKVFKLDEIKLELPNLITCGDINCQFTYFQISDFSQEKNVTNSLPQVLFVGGIHGDERLGPLAVMATAREILENLHANDTYSYYVRSRLMIFYPISNPTGFYQNKREEIYSNGFSLDPNRDFAYNVADNFCMRTAAGQALNYIFSNHLILTSISFHGGDNSISYPWGGENHVNVETGKSYKCPDHKAFNAVAEVLSTVASSNPIHGVNQYPFGTMTDLVYPVNGGLEDWVYSSGWENDFFKSEQQKPICNCKNPNNDSQIIQTQFQHLKCLLFLIEMADEKEPHESNLGTRTALYKGGNDWGHVTRNVALSLALIDLVKPYIRIVSMQIEDLSLKIKYQAMGCVKVSHTDILYKTHAFSQIKNESMTRIINLKKGPGYWSNPLHIYEFGINFESSIDLDLKIRLSCDEEFNIPFENAIPTEIPQTHYSKSRNEDNYSVHHNGYEIKGSKNIELKMEKVSLIDKSLNKHSAREIRFIAHMKLCDNIQKNDDIIIFDVKKSDKNPENFELNIMGNIENLSGNFEAFLNEDSNLDCDSYLFKKSPITNNDYLNNTHFVKFFDDKIDKEDFFLIRKDIKSELVIKLLGKSLILHGKEGKMIGKIKIEQNYQCENFGTDCLGFPLLDSVGHCESNLFSVFIKENDEFKGLYQNIIVKVNSTKKIFERFGRQITKLKIKNSDKSLIIKFDDSQENYISDILKFEMMKNEIVGNTLIIYLINHENKEIKLDSCEIFLKSNENFSDMVRKNIASESNSNVVFLGLIGSALILTLLFAIYQAYKKFKNSQMKQEKEKINMIKVRNKNSYNPVNIKYRNNQINEDIEEN